MTTWTTNPTLSKALENLPEGWRVARLGYEAWVRARLGWKGLTADEYVDDGYIFLATPNIKGKDIDFEDVNFITEERYHESPEIMLRSGDVLLTKDGATIGIVNRVRDLPRPATVNGSIAVITPTGDLTSRYLEYVLLSEYAQASMRFLQGGMGVPHLFQWDINRMSVPCPPADQQRAIADFLDRETAQIDTMIEAQQELVRGVEERRNAIIWTAVTKGVDAAPVLASQTAWIGDVPAHWEVNRLKVSVESIQSGAWGEDPKAGESDIRCVRVADFNRARRSVSDDDVTMRSLPASDHARFGLRRGDLLLEKSGGTGINPVGFVAMYDSDEPAVCSNFIGRMRLREGQVPRYWLFAHAASYLYRLTHRSVKQTTGIQNLDIDAYLNERFPFPPSLEQERIAAHLDRATARMDSMVDAANESIGLMRQRRAALISAAVTGQIDPRTGMERKVAV